MALIVEKGRPVQGTLTKADLCNSREKHKQGLGTGQKVLGGGKRGGVGGSRELGRVFEPLVRGGSFNFSYPLGVGHSGFFLWELAHI